MMMHDTQIIKEQSILKRGFFWAVTIDTTNKGSRPEIHARVERKSWLNYRIFLHRVDVVDTTNKWFLLDTTNKGFLLMLMMMNSKRTDLLG
jgi:hypothetical protein